MENNIWKDAICEKLRILRAEIDVLEEILKKCVLEESKREEELNDSRREAKRVESK